MQKKKKMQLALQMVSGYGAELNSALGEYLGLTQQLIRI